MRTTLRGKPLEQRFRALVQMGAPEECWLWMGRIDRDGYGRIQSGEKREIGAHRIALEQKLGRELASGELACHTCDNRRCCNPEHLFVGSINDNNQDCVRKDRHCRGERNGQSRLTEEQVVEIRARRGLGQSVARLAAEYGVSDRQIYYLVRGEKWRHTAAATPRETSELSPGGAA